MKGQRIKGVGWTRKGGKRDKLGQKGEKEGWMKMANEL